MSTMTDRTNKGYAFSVWLAALLLLTGCTSHKVYVNGGLGNNQTFLASAEIFDPSLGQFIMSSANMSTGRGGHSATLLADGRVLIAGGQNPSALKSAELYDPRTDIVSPTGMMNHIHVAHTATLLDPAVVSGPLGGAVLVAGGDDFSVPGTAELYRPLSGTFTATGNMTSPRLQHTAVLITYCGCPADGKVLVTGGLDHGSNVLASAELYDPVTQTFTATGGMTTRRFRHTATLLSDGRVLIAGGASAVSSSGGVNPSLSSAEIYDPRTGRFTAAGTMTSARTAHAASLLGDGSVLLTGGQDDHFLIVDSAELFDPQSNNFRTLSPSCNGNPSPPGCMSVSRDFHISVRLDDGRVLIAGGTNNQGAAIATAELYDPVSKSFAPTGNLSAGRIGPVAATVVSNIRPPPR